MSRQVPRSSPSKLLGWEQLVTSSSRSRTLAALESPIPENASSHGCGWPALAQASRPGDWKSGLLPGALKAEDGGGKFVQRGRRTRESSCFFIVRAATPARTRRSCCNSRPTPTTPTTTGAASASTPTTAGRTAGASRVVRAAAGEPVRQVGAALRRLGGERTATRSTTRRTAIWNSIPNCSKHYKLVLSVGHDEYWSAPMRDHLEAFIGKGGNVAFFSGNTCCWQVRSEDDGTALTCWKQQYQRWTRSARTGDHRRLSTLWSHHLVSRPENQLTGVGFLFGGYHRSHGQFMDGRRVTPCTGPTTGSSRAPA